MSCQKLITQLGACSKAIIDGTWMYPFSFSLQCSCTSLLVGIVWCSLTSGIVRLLQKFSNGALSLPELRGCSEKILMVFSLSENRVAAPMLQTVPLFRRCGCFHFATPFSVFDLLCFACGPPSAFSSRLPFENRPRSPPSEKQSPQISISLLLKTIFLSKQSPNLLYFSLPFKTHLLELFIANSSPSS